MKNKGIILSLALAGFFALSTVSCSTDVSNNTQKDPVNVYRNANDIKRGVNGVYLNLNIEQEIGFASVWTDEVAIGEENGGQGLIGGEHSFRMEPNVREVGGIWATNYGAINNINRLLIQADRLLAEIPNKNLTDAQKTSEISSIKDSKSDLYVLRAYSYIKLFAYFTPDYTNPNGLSVIKADESDVTENLRKHKARSTVQEIKDFILADLDRAEAVRGASWGASVDFVTLQMVNALRVKLYSMTATKTNGDYDKVLDYGARVLQDVKVAKANEIQSIFPRQEIKPAEDLPPANEVVFRLKRTVNTGPNVAGNWYNRSVGSGGAFFYEMSRSLYNDLDKLDLDNKGKDFQASRKDVRYAINLDPDTKVAVNYETLSQADYIKNDVLLIGKFQGMQGARIKNSVPAIRSTDILLLMAEARAAKGNLSSGTNDLGDLVTEGEEAQNVRAILATIRAYRSTDPDSVVIPTVSSEQDAYKQILEERRVEFAYEGYRYLDMKRLGVKAGSVGFVRYSKDAVVNGLTGLPATSHKLTFPIPTSELNSNPIVRGQQNPGY